MCTNVTVCLHIKGCCAWVFIRLSTLVGTRDPVQCLSEPGKNPRTFQAPPLQRRASPRLHSDCCGHPLNFCLNCLGSKTLGSQCVNSLDTSPVWVVWPEVGFGCFLPVGSVYMSKASPYHGVYQLPPLLPSPTPRKGLAMRNMEGGISISCWLSRHKRPH